MASLNSNHLYCSKQMTSNFVIIKSAPTLKVEEEGRKSGSESHKYAICIVGKSSFLLSQPKQMTTGNWQAGHIWITFNSTYSSLWSDLHPALPFSQSYSLPHMSLFNNSESLVNPRSSCRSLCFWLCCFLCLEWLSMLLSTWPTHLSARRLPSLLAWADVKPSSLRISLYLA